MAAISSVKKFRLDIGSDDEEKRSARPIRRGCSSSPAPCPSFLALSPSATTLLSYFSDRRSDWISRIKRITNKLSTVESISRWPLNIYVDQINPVSELRGTHFSPYTVEFFFLSLHQTVEQLLFPGIGGDWTPFLEPLSDQSVLWNRRPLSHTQGTVAGS